MKILYTQLKPSSHTMCVCGAMTRTSNRRSQMPQSVWGLKHRFNKLKNKSQTFWSGFYTTSSVLCKHKLFFSFFFTPWWHELLSPINNQADWNETHHHPQNTAVKHFQLAYHFCHKDAMKSIIINKQLTSSFKLMDMTLEVTSAG